MYMICTGKKITVDVIRAGTAFGAGNHATRLLLYFYLSVWPCILEWFQSSEVRPLRVARLHSQPMLVLLSGQHSCWRSGQHFDEHTEEDKECWWLGRRPSRGSLLCSKSNLIFHSAERKAAAASRGFATLAAPRSTSGPAVPVVYE